MTTMTKSRIVTRPPIENWLAKLSCGHVTFGRSVAPLEHNKMECLHPDCDGEQRTIMDVISSDPQVDDEGHPW